MVFDTNIMTSKLLKFKRKLRRLRETGHRAPKCAWLVRGASGPHGRGNNRIFVNIFMCHDFPV